MASRLDASTLVLAKFLLFMECRKSLNYTMVHIHRYDSADLQNMELDLSAHDLTEATPCTTRKLDARHML